MKKLTALTSSLGAYLTLATSAFAQETVETCPTGSFEPLCDLNFANVIPSLISTIFIIAIVIALFYLIWGGLKWLTSGGDKAAVQAAREHIVAAIVGLVLIFLAYFILNIVLQFFLGISLGTFTLPQIPRP